MEQNQSNTLRDLRATVIAPPPEPHAHHTYYVDPDQKPLSQQQIDSVVYRLCALKTKI